MRIRRKGKEAGGFSRAKLLLGAGGLLLFIIGIKRSHRLDGDAGIELPGEDPATDRKAEGLRTGKPR